MTQAISTHSTPAPSRRGVLDLQEQLVAAGMRLVAQSGGRDRYLILWKHQAVARDMTLIEAARFIDRALRR
jgi:hypothetical protein